MTAPAVFFYISAHGFGHAVRQTAVMNALLAEAAGRVRLVVRTSAPSWLFARTVRGAFALMPGATDTGVVQLDALRLDERATMRDLVAFHDTLPERVAAEAAILRTCGAAVVIADAPPLACAAAARAGVPAVVCANFTWDWIYEQYVDGGPAASALSAIRHAYSGASGWRLPMHGGFDTVRAVRDVPLVARHARAGRSIADVRRALSLPADRPLALASFGGYGARDLPLDQLDCVPDWHVVVTTRETPPPPGAAGVHVLHEDQIYAHGLGYEDVVGAVDVVVTKPGYGIVSDCAANDTAVLYTSRGRFAEYEILVREMPRWVRSRFVPLEDLRAGRWHAALEELHAMAPLPDKPPASGAQVVARLILDELGLI